MASGNCTDDATIAARISRETSDHYTKLAVTSSAGLLAMCAEDTTDSTLSARSRTPLALASDALVDEVNAAIRAGRLVDRAGKP